MEIKARLRRLAGAGVAVAFATTLLVAGSPGAATAAPTTAEEAVDVATISTIRYNGTGRRCVDSNADGNVYTLNCNGGAHQRWDNYRPGKFRNVATGKCLASSRTAVFTTSCSLNVTDWTTNSGSPKRIRNVQAGLCLHNNGGQNEHLGVRVCSTAATWTIP